MKVIFRIKWENIITLMVMLTSIYCWFGFITDSNVYTLAIAVISTFMTLMLIMSYESLKTLRLEIIKIK